MRTLWGVLARVPLLQHPVRLGLIAWAVTLPFSQGMAGQTTIHVPADVPTIQGGIDAAHSGDTVLVAPGTYTENLDFKGKAIAVTSGAASYAGAAATVIQGTGNGPVVVFQTNETRASILNGFTIQKGTSNAVYLSGASGTVSNNAITNNLGCGVGVVGATASPLIVGNDIAYTGDAATGSPCLAGPPGTGIGLYDAGNVEIIGNTIENNGTIRPGTGNVLEYSPGAGIFAVSETSVTTLSIENNIIRNNIASADGAAISTWGIAHQNVIQNLIYGNMTSGGVPGISLVVPYYGIPKGIVFSQTLVNNSIYGNVNVLAAPNHEAQTGNQANLGVEDPEQMSPFDVENNLFIATDQYGTVSCGTDSESPLTYRNNDAFYAGATQPLLCTPSGSLLAVDPQFLDPATFDFRLRRASPVVGAGDIDALNLPPADLAGKNRTVCGSIDLGAYQTHPQPPIGLTSLPNPSVGGSNTTISAHLTGNCHIPTGTVTFFDGAVPIGMGILDANGDASLTTAGLTVGNHTITATYPGDFNFDPSTSTTLLQTVTGYPSAITLQVSPNPAGAFQPITFSAVASSAFGVPTGTVTFFAGANALGTAPVNAGGAATLTLSTLGAGTYSITAVYNASIYYAQSTSPTVIEIVNGAATGTVLTSAPNPSVFGQPVTFTATVTAPLSSNIPPGTVSFMDGAITLGAATLSSGGIATFTTSALAVGNHPVTAVYGGSPNDNGSTSNLITQVVTLDGTKVTIAGSPNPANVGQPVTLTATISSSYGSSPTGTIVFADQFGTIGSSQIASGQAIFTTSALALGTHTIVASFAGGGGFAPGVSPALAEVIQISDFSIGVSPQTLTLKAGKQGQVAVELSSSGSYSGTIGLSAGTLPQYMSVSFNPASAGLAAGGSASSVLTIKTAEPPPNVGFERRPSIPGRNTPFALAGLVMLPLLFQRRTRNRVATFTLATFVMFSTFGCTTISYRINTVAPGTYVIPIRAIDPSTAVTHTVSLTIVVN